MQADDTRSPTPQPPSESTAAAVVSPGVELGHPAPVPPPWLEIPGPDTTLAALEAQEPNTPLDQSLVVQLIGKAKQWRNELIYLRARVRMLESVNSELLEAVNSDLQSQVDKWKPSFGIRKRSASEAMEEVDRGSRCGAEPSEVEPTIPDEDPSDAMVAVPVVAETLQVVSHTPDVFPAATNVPGMSAYESASQSSAVSATPSVAGPCSLDWDLSRRSSSEIQPLSPRMAAALEDDVGVEVCTLDDPW